ncbi:Ribosomal RNA small subunit methyltransferase I [Candidatus Kinetoplastibacterium sorsogonicusi]|uniref:Ribosomal RNA small subunit methyltransferase I n=1 Tax=Candidatus Kinetoplastidibacterium kentomonadis TaxID=1576550 RepID=A0A3S7JAN6_9PROT|nr:16S rRNA (cytidine(1402)-2'-O)-methyltransferase [Candidatus Kinetoplastibacterium sorsogonicusi]AWD32729.1 Ribosomal RNA small subunit methyltransferase I [Candidatus Kinetoplastibacterium sorsogonicusi]
MINSLENIYNKVKSQSWIDGALYVVSTPIGNLGDISFRALYTLSIVDTIAVEDTRLSGILLKQLSIKKPLILANKYKEEYASHEICKLLSLGKKVALISDAGSPAISDPGAIIVKNILLNGYRVIPIPGASSVIAAIMSSGIISENNSAYLFAGFIPSKKSAKLNWLKNFQYVNYPVIMFEVIHRINISINDFLNIYNPSRIVTIAKELTKIHEEIITDSIDNLYNKFVINEKFKFGEYVIILHPDEISFDKDIKLKSKIDYALSQLMKKQTLKESVNIIVNLTGAKNNYVYSRALLQLNNNKE